MFGTNLWSLDRGLQRWLRRLGFHYLPVVSAEAVDLFGDRRRARSRSCRLVLPLLLAAAAVLVYELVWGSGLARTRSDDPAQRWSVLTADTLVTTGLIGWRWLVSRAERRVGRLLRHRMTRPTTTSLLTVLGRKVAAGVALGAVVTPVMVAIVFAQRVDATAWVFGGTCLAAWAFAFAGVWSALSRPVIAVDPLSLAVDDRLRSYDACWACIPLPVAALLFSATEGPTANTWIYVLASAAPFVLCALISPANVGGRRWDAPSSAPPRVPQHPSRVR